MRTGFYGYGNNYLTQKESLKVVGSAFVKILNADNAIASLFKSSIGKIDRSSKIGRV